MLIKFFKNWITACNCFKQYQEMQNLRADFWNVFETCLTFLYYLLCLSPWKNIVSNPESQSSSFPEEDLFLSIVLPIWEEWQASRETTGLCTSAQWPAWCHHSMDVSAELERSSLLLWFCQQRQKSVADELGQCWSFTRTHLLWLSWLTKISHEQGVHAS